MYRDAELRKYQYYLHLTWSGVFFTLFLEFTSEIILLQVVFMQVPLFLDLGMQFFPKIVPGPSFKLFSTALVHFWQELGLSCNTWVPSMFPEDLLVIRLLPDRGYLESCRNIVNSARKISEAIRTSISELYVVGDPPASVVAFASKHPNVDVMEVGDIMNKRGWHLNALLDPKAIHIACTVS